MKVWLVNQYAIPPMQAGITRHYDYARALIEIGHQVSIIASSFDHVVQKETRLADNEAWRLSDEMGVPFLWLRTPPYKGNSFSRVLNMLAFSWRMLLINLPQKLGRPDVIVGSSPHLLGALSAWALARQLGVPFVLEVRDLWPQSLVELGNYPARHPLVVGLEWIERHLYRNADRIITLLPQSVQHMVDKGASHEKIVCIPNGVVLSRIPDQPPIRTGNPFTFMYAGSHGLMHNLKPILEATRILQDQTDQPPIRVRLVGDGPDKAGLMEYAKQIGLTESSLRFENPVPKDQIYARLLEADAFILSMKNVSLWNNGISFNKLYDFMACGRPIVFGVEVSNNAVQAADAGITIPADSPAQMAAAMRRIADLSLEERRAMGIRARRYALENHDIGCLSELYAKILSESLSSGRPVTSRL